MGKRSAWTARISTTGSGCKKVCFATGTDPLCTAKYHFMPRDICLYLPFFICPAFLTVNSKFPYSQSEISAAIACGIWTLNQVNSCVPPCAFLDVQGVSGSGPLASTIKGRRFQRKRRPFLAIQPIVLMGKEKVHLPVFRLTTQKATVGKGLGLRRIFPPEALPVQQ